MSSLNQTANKPCYLEMILDFLAFFTCCCCSILELVAKHDDDAACVDLSSKVEIAPVVIPPGMPLTFIYHVMQEQGLNYIPVIRQHGPLEGMVSRCACKSHLILALLLIPMCCCYCG